MNNINNLGVKGDTGDPGDRGDNGDRGPRGLVGKMLYQCNSCILTYVLLLKHVTMYHVPNLSSNYSKIHSYVRMCVSPPHGPRLLILSTASAI